MKLVMEKHHEYIFLTILLISILHHTSAQWTRNAVYIKTKNMSESSYSKSVFTSLFKPDLKKCGEYCLHYQSRIGSQRCNAFAFDKSSSTCDLAAITFLENPEVAGSEKEIFVNFDDADTLDMICRNSFKFLQSRNYTV
ncbi:uncharacterized protein LOC111716511, partial [Eurytemora carolleeae]|uniref:uncharacterized protein LOC111716511 n=1 Tax=Eurytemora carolleeae TaxID=1294199 RepID=UPI000C75877C